MDSGNGSLTVQRGHGLQPPGLWAEILAGQTRFALSHLKQTRKITESLKNRFHRVSSWGQDEEASGEIPQSYQMHTAVSSLPKWSFYTDLQMHSCADGQPLSFLCLPAASNGFSDQCVSTFREYLALVQLSSHGSQGSPGQGAVTP